MSPFLLTARIGISDEGTIEEGVEDTVESTVEETVSDTRFMNMARFGVGDTERVIGSMSVCLPDKVVVEREDIVHEMEFKFLHVLFFGLAPHEPFPGFEEIFGRDDMIVSEI